MASTTRPLIGIDKRTGVRGFDWLLLLSALVPLAFGFLSLYSLGIRDGAPYFRKQAAMSVAGLVPFGVFFFVNPQWWRKAAWGLYVANLLLLTAVLFVGVSTKGAQRWIDLRFMQFQPSEAAKILTVLTLASFLSARQSTISRPSTLLLSFAHVAVPAFLIAKQPHYGGAMVLLVIWICVCIAGNVPMKSMLISLVVLIGGGIIAAQVPGALHGYHLRRLESMEQDDKAGAGYQQDRAEVALGVGGISGDGLFRGRQSLPEQENDFVFTVLGEELGFVGCCLLLASYGFLFYRIWLVMIGATEPFYRMVASGILGILAFHTILNLGMVLHLLPVVGLWLPFMSAGGTALWLCMACTGLLLKVRSRERPILF